MNSLDFLDTALVKSQVGTVPYFLPEEKKMKHRLVGSLMVDQFRGNIRLPFPMNFVFPNPMMRIEELNFGDNTMFTNKWPFYKGGRIWPPAKDEETTEEPVEEPVVDPEPETPETPVTPDPTPEVTPENPEVSP